MVEILLIAQGLGAGFSLEQIIELTGMSAVAAILLWNTLGKSREQDKCFRGLSVTLITLQQSLLVYTMSGRNSGSNDADECQKLLAAYAEVNRLLETQRRDLERHYAEGK